MRGAGHFSTATICSTENRLRFIGKILLRRILPKTNPQPVLTFGEPLTGAFQDDDWQRGGIRSKSGVKLFQVFKQRINIHFK